MENNEKRLQTVAAINSEPEDCYFRFLSEQRDGRVFIIKQLWSIYLTRIILSVGDFIGAFFLTRAINIPPKLRQNDSSLPVRGRE